MKAKTIEDLRKEYLKGEFKNYRRFLEQKLIQPELQRGSENEMVYEIDFIILNWLKSKSENTTQLSFDIVQYFKSLNQSK